MVIYRKCSFVFAVVECQNFMIFNILEDENIFTADCFKKFGLELTICKISKPCINLEYRRSVLICSSPDTHVTSLQIIVQINSVYQIFFS